MKKFAKKKARQEQELELLANDSIKDLKKEFKKPNAIPAHKAPKGNGSTKGDILMQRLAVEFEYDPIHELIRLARNKTSSNELQYKIACQLADYYLPKVKAIDTNPNQGEVIALNIVFPE